MIEECLYDCRKLPCSLLLSFQLVPILEVSTAPPAITDTFCKLCTGYVANSMFFRLAYIKLNCYGRDLSLTFPEAPLSMFPNFQLPLPVLKIDVHCTTYAIMGHFQQIVLIGKFSALSPGLYQI